ncbi:MAG: hypothetical protein KJZ84_07030 [Bryobacteraceae bacterium]|nr:hypothetical protein [Bryobacteraceae bacterium]
MNRPSFTAILLCAVIIAPAPMFSQQDPRGVTPQAPESTAVYNTTGLRILILEGQNAVNSLTAQEAVSPVVQVLDAVNQPVEGATVTFEVPPTGPGGTFAGQIMATVKTDSTGQATAAFTPNSIAGPFVIKVTATFEGQTKTARIRQTNDARVLEATLPTPPKPWYKSGKRWALIGAGAGAGIAAAVILTRKGRTPTITISPGTIGIGGPQ